MLFFLKPNTVMISHHLFLRQTDCVFTEKHVITGHPVLTTKGRDNQLKAHPDKIQGDRGTVVEGEGGDD